ncbi:hypothetical protein OG203_19720 [Nocardia sp. NBC_01499]|uniref:hypothetical protein n=1 Tax=Nocardia sp. NBC_01499 TaxID=2903597 RepID=UPI00386A142D
MSDEQATPETTDLGEIPATEITPDDAGVQQIPATVSQAAADPTAAVTREKLLVAIGQEADRIANNETVQASKALEELARAYALVALGRVVVDESGSPIALHATPGARVSSFADWAASA